MHIPVYFLAHVTSWSLYVDGKQGRRICRHMRIVSLTHQTRTTIEPQIGWYRSKRLIVLGLEADLVSNESIMIALMTDRIFSFPMQTWICIRSKIGQHISGFWFYHQKKTLAIWDHHPDMVGKNFEILPTSSITIQGETPS